jgi:hypothetical protein
LETAALWVYDGVKKVKCEARRDNILLYAADALDASERDELRSHLATGCPRCSGALAEAQAVLALLPGALAATAPPPGARDRLMRIVGAVNPPLQAPGRRPRIGWKWMIGTAMGSAALAASITLAVMWGPFREGREVVNSKDLRLVSLNSTTGPASRGRIFWDRDKNDWRLYVFDLAPPPPGRTYELWFITPSGAVAAGTFDVGKSGRGSLEVPLPPNLGPIAAAAISDEPMNGSQTPTGTIWLQGKVN